jgi:SAM-dependent methyltransferase
MREENSGWSEENSRSFLDSGRYYVPDREEQIDIVCSMVPALEEPFRVLELACGPGLLAKALLQRYPSCSVLGLDGSGLMLQTARGLLAPFGERFAAQEFDLSAGGWRDRMPVYQAVVSSLAVHHLDDGEKAALFRDVYQMLRPGGAFVVADIIRPACPRSNAIAAEAYDDVVRRQAQQYDGDLRVFEQFQRDQWNLFRYPDDSIDKPSTLFDQLRWLVEAGFRDVDAVWMRAGHAIFSGEKSP